MSLAPTSRLPPPSPAVGSPAAPLTTGSMSVVVVPPTPTSSPAPSSTEYAGMQIGLKRDRTTTFATLSADAPMGKMPTSVASATLPVSKQMRSATSLSVSHLGGLVKTEEKRVSRAGSSSASLSPHAHKANSLYSLAGDLLFGALPLCVLSTECNVVDCNAALLQLFGYSRSDLLQMSLFQLACTAEIKDVFGMMEKLIEIAAKSSSRTPAVRATSDGDVDASTHPSLQVYERRCVIASGEIKNFQMTIWLARTPAGQPPVFLCAITPAATRSDCAMEDISAPVSGSSSTIGGSDDSSSAPTTPKSIKANNVSANNNHNGAVASTTITNATAPATATPTTLTAAAAPPAAATTATSAFARPSQPTARRHSGSQVTPATPTKPTVLAAPTTTTAVAPPQLSALSVLSEVALPTMPTAEVVQSQEMQQLQQVQAHAAQAAQHAAVQAQAQQAAHAAAAAAAATQYHILPTYTTAAPTYYQATPSFLGQATVVPSAAMQQQMMAQQQQQQQQAMYNNALAQQQQQQQHVQQQRYQIMVQQQPQQTLYASHMYQPTSFMPTLTPTLTTQLSSASVGGATPAGGALPNSS